MIAQIVFPTDGESAKLAVENRSVEYSGSRIIQSNETLQRELTLSDVRPSVASNLFDENTSSHTDGRDGRDCLHEVSCDL